MATNNRRYRATKITTENHRQWVLNLWIDSNPIQIHHGSYSGCVKELRLEQRLNEYNHPEMEGHYEIVPLHHELMMQESKLVQNLI